MFRMRFFAKGQPLEYPGESQDTFSLSIDGKTFHFQAIRKNEPFIWPERHVITCEGFSTGQEAWEAGNRCRNALYMLGVKMRRNLDLGNNKVTSPTNEADKRSRNDAAREQGYEVRHYDKVHGLAVYPEIPLPRFDFEGFGYVTTEGPPRPTFSDVFEDNYRLNWSLDEREFLACALYGATLTEVSTRARFIFLVNVIESLTESEERSPQALAHVEHLIELTKESELEQSAKKSLLDSMKWLCYESINHMAKTLINQHLKEKKYGGMKAHHFFRHCYTIRSSLLHTGKSAVEENMLSIIINDLDMLVQDLLDSLLRKLPTDGA